MIIEWDEIYIVGIEELDNHHKKLIYLLHEFSTGMESGWNKEKLGDRLDFMLYYSQCHFIAEEDLMLEHGYPKYEDHRLEHDSFLSKEKGLHAALMENDPKITAGLAPSIWDWWKNHLIVTDKKYKSYFNGRGFSRVAGIKNSGAF